ncbi:hypothetical protein [Asticcacaulis sp. AND118]|uniref:hypothetical protein n=1 Tax=Asticcacaulis sp. AND118 TaxID=2840468 RepID=UPI001CFFC118|nr:hypothetical protein [Asticcacaulis sp. AND118]UDF03861.1 hypothetical protein LH365_02105 [Asticcacaulis sp. AND118]
MTGTVSRSFVKAALLLAAVSGMGLTACAKQGDLERAPPLWGKRAQDEVAAKKKAQAEGKATERALPRKEFKNEMPDPYQQNSKVADAPLEGTGNAQRQ